MATTKLVNINVNVSDWPITDHCFQKNTFRCVIGFTSRQEVSQAELNVLLDT